jgi:hypothetical protein
MEHRGLQGVYVRGLKVLEGKRRELERVRKEYEERVREEKERSDFEIGRIGESEEEMLDRMIEEKERSIERLNGKIERIAKNREQGKIGEKEEKLEGMGELVKELELAEREYWDKKRVWESMKMNEEGKNWKINSKLIWFFGAVLALCTGLIASYQLKASSNT